MKPLCLVLAVVLCLGVGCSIPPQQGDGNKGPTPVTQWQYTSLILRGQNDNRLNALGKLGWELVAVSGAAPAWFVFKRVQVAALEAIRTGTTTIVENVGNIQRHAAALAESGLRCVFAESVRDAENVRGPMSPERLVLSDETPRFSATLRDQGMQRISDLFSSWHGAEQGRISVFPAAGLVETSSPELLRAVRAFAEEHDLGYTIHLNQSRAEFEFMVRYHGVRPAEYLDRHDFLGPRLFAAHARYVNDAEIQLLGRSGTTISHQAAMAANRGVSPPIPALREAGCTIALGTDNNTNDVFEVMRIALVTERIRRNRDGDEVPGLKPQPEDMLADATQGGARAVQQEELLGTLEVGKRADILVIDTQRAHLVPAGPTSFGKANVFMKLPRLYARA